MKVIIIIPSLIATLASASFTEMENLFSKIIANATGGPNDRAFAPNAFGLSLAEGVASNYGCWCHSLNEHTGKGKSRPVDDLDALCKRLADGYDCAAIDAEERGDSECEAWDVHYSDEEGNAIECSKMRTQKEVDDLGLNQVQVEGLGFLIVSTCKKQACEIELDFVQKVAKLYKEDYARNPIYEHSSASFSDDAECVTKPCTGDHCNDRETKCCGPVPGRRTYKNLSDIGEERKCCFDKTVWLDNGLGQHECCPDGSVAGTGTCP